MGGGVGCDYIFDCMSLSVMRKWNDEFQCDGKFSVMSLSVILTSIFKKKHASLSVIYRISGNCKIHIIFLMERTVSLWRFELRIAI